MNKRISGTILLSAFIAVLLCGCAVQKIKNPVSLVSPSDSSYSDTHSGISYITPDISQIIQPQSAVSSSDDSSDVISWESIPQSVEPVEDVSSMQPANISESTSTAESEPEIVTEPDPVNSILNDYTKKWAYNHISVNQQMIYQRLFACAESVATECDVSDLKITADDIYTVFWAFDYDNPQFLELGSGFTYNYTPSETQDKMNKIMINYGRDPNQIFWSDFDVIVQTILTNANAQLSDYEKLKYIHDWLVNNTVYTNTDALYESEADGPVIYGKALCEGYSKAFMYFAQSMGFECVCIAGSVKSGDHMWNMVKLDGQWYHVDVTWDDPVMSDGSQSLRYDYFLKSDSEIMRDHSIDTPFVAPSAPSSYITY